MAYLGRKGASAALTTADIPDNSITAAKIVADTIAAGDIAADAVGTAELANDVAISTTGAITTTGGMTVDGATVFNEASADADFRIEGNGEANLFYVDASTDRIGIGTAAPTTMLDLYRNDSTETKLRINNQSTGDAVLQYTGTANWYVGIDNSDSDSYKIANDDSFNANVRMTINSSGNVGIGTTAPDDLLHVYKGDSGAAPHSDAVAVIEHSGNAVLQFLTPATDAAAIYFGDPAHTNDGGIIYHQSSLYMSFRVNDAERMRIDSGGNLCIGNTNAGYKLDVDGNFRARGPIYLTEEGTLGSGTAADSAIKWHDILFMHDGGAEYRLEEVTSGDVIMKWNRSGAVYAHSFTSSDELLKKDIVDVPYGLTEVLAMKPKSFTLKRNGIQSMGFIAQEIETLFPEIVSGKDAEIKKENVEIEKVDGTTETRTTYTDGKSLDYNAFSAVLCKAIQELSAKNDALEAKVTTLENA